MRRMRCAARNLIRSDSRTSLHSARNDNQRICPPEEDASTSDVRIDCCFSRSAACTLALRTNRLILSFRFPSLGMTNRSCPAERDRRSNASIHLSNHIVSVRCGQNPYLLRYWVAVIFSRCLKKAENWLTFSKPSSAAISDTVRSVEVSNSLALLWRSCNWYCAGAMPT